MSRIGTYLLLSMYFYLPNYAAHTDYILGQKKWLKHTQWQLVLRLKWAKMLFLYDISLYFSEIFKPEPQSKHFKLKNIIISSSDQCIYVCAIPGGLPWKLKITKLSIASTVISITCYVPCCAVALLHCKHRRSLNGMGAIQALWYSPINTKRSLVEQGAEQGSATRGSQSTCWPWAGDW